MLNIEFNPPDPRRYLSAKRFADVQGVLRERARRREHLCSEILTEPAWDILLELYAYYLLDRRPPVAELTERINVPDTTALRWIKVLDAAGLVERDVGSGMAGEARARLTPAGLKAMEGYFSAVGTIFAEPRPLAT